MALSNNSSSVNISSGLTTKRISALNTSVALSDPPEIDIDSEYKIAKKKELLLKKLNQLKAKSDGEEITKVLIDQAQNLLEEFE